MNAGAKGYITKNSAPEVLSEAIQCIYQGDRYIESGLLKDDQQQQGSNDSQLIIQSFSAREFDVFRLLAKGLAAYKVAVELCIGYKTVANYVTQIKKKLHIASIVELAYIAVILGITKH